MLKTIFFGTPSPAVPFLEQLHAVSEVILVVTQPDKPSGRGLEVKPCPVKKRALELGLKVVSPEKFKDIVPDIAALNADLGVAVAYGKIFRKPALEAIKLGIINIHFSLLPKYRGAAPVQHTLFNGETKTGITAFWIDEGLDTGLIAAQDSLDILPQDDANTLFEKLIKLGLNTLGGVIKDIESGKIVKIPQQGEPSFAPMIEKPDTVVNFNTMSAEKIHNFARGLSGGMPAFAKAVMPNGETAQLLKTSLKPLPVHKQGKAGSVIYIERGLGFFVQCNKDVLFIETIRPAGKNTMSAWAYCNGKKLTEGAVIFD